MLRLILTKINKCFRSAVTDNYKIFDTHIIKNMDTVTVTVTFYPTSYQL